ncbi:hypothetical protein Tco_1321555 [Tanacetum coccineum]
MHTRASNSELVEPLPELERTLNQRLHQQNRRVPYDQRNNPPQHPRIVYPPILNINYFHHFLDILQNYDPMDDEPMWAADRLRMKEILENCHVHNLSKSNIQNLLSWSQAEYPKILNAAASGSNNTNTDKIMARMDAMTIKIDAQYKELQSRAKQPTSDLVDDDIPMSREEEAKFMQTFWKTSCYYNDYHQRPRL